MVKDGGVLCVRNSVVVSVLWQEAGCVCATVCLGVLCVVVDVFVCEESNRRSKNEEAKGKESASLCIHCARKRQSVL